MVVGVLRKAWLSTVVRICQVGTRNTFDSHKVTCPSCLDGAGGWRSRGFLQEREVRDQNPPWAHSLGCPVTVSTHTRARTLAHTHTHTLAHTPFTLSLPVISRLPVVKFREGPKLQGGFRLCGGAAAPLWGSRA